MFGVALNIEDTGVLFLLYSCVLMIFWRVFMRISYSCPQHLKFALNVESWTNLVQLTGDAIDWLDLNDKLYDVWMLVAYAATSCALVQVSVGLVADQSESAHLTLSLAALTSTTRGLVVRIKMRR